MPAPHRHAFFHAARTPQPALTCGEDVARLADLDPTLWVILARPTAFSMREMRAFHVAALLDTDGDGRVRMQDVLAAIEWLRPRLAAFDRLFRPFDGLLPEDLRADTPEGKPLADLLAEIAPDGGPLTEQALWEARRERLGSDPAAPGKVALNAASLREPLRMLAMTLLRVCPGIEDHGALDRTGFEAGCGVIDRAVAWRAAYPNGLRAYGDLLAFLALRKPVEDYFRACETLRYDPSSPPLAHDPAKPLREGPIALPSATASGLPLHDGLNPEWKWCAETIARWTGRDDERLSPEMWRTLCEQFAPLTAWWETPTLSARERDAFLDQVGMDDTEKVSTLTDPELRKELERLIAAEEAKTSLRATFGELEKLLRLRAGFLRFLRNFVNVADLYPPTAAPLFLEGRLYLDGRCCTLCFPLGTDVKTATHAAAAKASRCCLAYCLATRKGAADHAFLAVFTAGSTGHLEVGKRGIYVDDLGHDWDAVITHLEINTVSLTEAFFAPWRKIGETCSETLRKLVAGKGDAAVVTATSAVVSTTASAETAKPPALPSGSQMASVATLGIALSFVASAVAALAAAVTHTPLWKTGAVVAGIILAVSVPSVVLAWFRLRNRDLAPILNASGWAINLPIGLTARLGAFFTHNANYLGRRFVRRPKSR